LSEAGVPVDIIRDQFGHSNITMTNTYPARSRDRLARAPKQPDGDARTQGDAIGPRGLSRKQAKSV
jgi:integrase